MNECSEFLRENCVKASGYIVYSLRKVIPPLNFVACLLASDFSSKGQGKVDIVDEEVSSIDVNAPSLRWVAPMLMVCCCSKDLNGVRPAMLPGQMLLTTKYQPVHPVHSLLPSPLGQYS